MYPARPRPVRRETVCGHVGQRSLRRLAFGLSYVPEPESTTFMEPSPRSDDDVMEEVHARGITDGLPVVLPTRDRVEQAIAASGRAGDELIGLVAPRYGRATVQKIAVNAVMAGHRPEYLRCAVMRRELGRNDWQARGP